VWGNLDGQARRTVDSVDLLAPNIAVAHVTAEFGDEQIPRLSETFVVIKHDGAWKIQVHQAVLPGARMEP